MRRVAVVLAGLALAGCMRTGGPAPDFALPDLSGKAVRLSSLRGRVVLLNVWTTWCPPCREEMPSLEALFRRLHGPDFVVLAVSADERGLEAVRPFVEGLRLSFPVLIDKRGEVVRKYAVTGYPETFIIDRAGRIVDHLIGPREWSEPKVEQVLRHLIDTGEWDGGL